MSPVCTPRLANVRLQPQRLQTAASRCRLQAGLLDGLMGRRRSPHFANEVCRVVRAAHAGVLRDLWIGTDWPCTRLRGCRSLVMRSTGQCAILPDSRQRSIAAIQFTWFGPGPVLVHITRARSWLLPASARASLSLPASQVVSASAPLPSLTGARTHALKPCCEP